MSNGVVIHGNITTSAVEAERTYESPYSQYDTVANGEPPPRKETMAEFDNPLYSDTGPVTFSESTLYESVSVLLSTYHPYNHFFVTCIPTLD